MLENSRECIKDFMVSNKVGEKKAKGQVYDFIIKQLPDTKRKTLCRQTQKALRIDDLFEKIGMDKLQYIKTYSADTISKFSNSQILTIIDHFIEKPNTEFTDNPVDEKQDDEVPIRIMYWKSCFQRNEDNTHDGNSNSCSDDSDDSDPDNNSGDEMPNFKYLSHLSIKNSFY
ncbi:unnamed protein product [Rhizophagus irregularis]|nr:unnamed protein product [Rhizophagus irregularis]